MRNFVRCVGKEEKTGRMEGGKDGRNQLFPSSNLLLSGALVKKKKLEGWKGGRMEGINSFPLERGALGLSSADEF